MHGLSNIALNGMIDAARAFRRGPDTLDVARGVTDARIKGLHARGPVCSASRERPSVPFPPATTVTPGSKSAVGSRARGPR